jgi:RNA polymerase sigma factor (TIGR02999 family)
MPTPRPRDVTQLLQAWADGDDQALRELFPLVYDELRRLARRHLAAERMGHTLQPTALVHETYFRLIPQRGVEWRERAQFYRIAAKSMRRILIDHARGRRARKRGGDRPHLPIEAAREVARRPAPDLLRLDEALSALARFDPLKASIVELRFFGGLSIDATAALLGCSRPTVVRHWGIARTWLYGELERSAAGGA